MVNFEDIAWYAHRARVAYQDEQAIRKAYPETVHVAQPDGTDVLYFLEEFTDQQRQVVTIRGTDNVDNVLQDAEYLREKDHPLGISVHRGFDADTRAVYADLKPRLNPQYETLATGHSLGAAISTLLMMYLHDDGFRVGPSINFGQPKLTNKQGAEKYAELPLLRVVDGNDVVPLLPTATLLDSLGGVYTHLGQEVVLLNGPHYAFLDQQAAMHESRGSFWKDLGHESLKAHKVDNYVKNSADKLEESVQVPFKEREKYLKG